MLWLDTEGGTLVTSTAFAQAVPAWASPFADGAAVARAFAPVWEPLDAGWLAAHAATRDDQDGEGDYLGLGTVFPAQRDVGQGDARDAGRRSAAARARDAPRPRTPPRPRPGGRCCWRCRCRRTTTSTHVFGPDSWEAWDELRRLDRGLAELLAALDALVGPDGYAVMLTGDHGSNPLPEISRAGLGAWCRRGRARARDHWQRPVRRAARGSIAADIARRLDEARTIVAGVMDPFVYLTDRGQGAAARRARGAAAADRCAVRGQRRRSPR